MAFKGFATVSIGYKSAELRRKLSEHILDFQTRLQEDGYDVYGDGFSWRFDESKVIFIGKETENGH